MTVDRSYTLPFVFDTIDLAGGTKTFWKQLLPLDGQINYNGTKIKFTKGMLDKIVQSYKDKAYPQVAFQLADDNNSHPTEEEERSGNMDPRRYQGELSDLKLDKRGLIGKFDLTNDGAELIGKNPKLGVSVSIKCGYKRADGEHFPYAIKHVLGTLDPKVTALSPWSTVELSNEGDEEVRDLTSAQITEPADKDKDKDKETVTVAKDEWDEIRAYVKAQKEADSELASLLNEDDKNDKDNKDTVDASNKTSPAVVDLSNRVARAEFDRYADNLVRDGVPPVMIDKARKVLGVSDLVELSNDGGDNDPRKVLREILEEARGTVDLSSAIGHPSSGDEAQRDEEEFKKISDSFLSGI